MSSSPPSSWRPRSPKARRQRNLSPSSARLHRLSPRCSRTRIPTGRQTMARILVLAEPAQRLRQSPVAGGQPVLLDERVDSVHLCDDHAAGRLIERLAWAVCVAGEVKDAAIVRRARIGTVQQGGGGGCI